jgi:hypothetical protein
MKTSVKIHSKRIYAGNAVVSLRIEGMKITASLKKDLAAYSKGDVTINQLIQATKSKYVSV